MSAVAKELREAGSARQEAMQRYKDAILEAKSKGLTNVEIARVLGVSEGAIRMFAKRHHLQANSELKKAS
jgi:DNA-directed RNA polymerase specialized sigma24 family protein